MNNPPTPVDGKCNSAPSPITAVYPSVHMGPRGKTHGHVAWNFNPPPFYRTINKTNEPQKT